MSSSTDVCATASNSFDALHSSDQEDEDNSEDEQSLLDCVNLSSLSLSSSPPFPYTPDLPPHLRQVLLLSLLYSLRSAVPPSGLSPCDPSTLLPTASQRRFGSEEGCWFADSDEINSFILDEWLWDERERKALLWRGDIPAFYCQQCHHTIAHHPPPLPPSQEEEEEVNTEDEGDRDDTSEGSDVPLPPPTCPHCGASAESLHPRTHITHSCNFSHLSLLFSHFLPSHIPAMTSPDFTVLDIGSRLCNVLYHSALTLPRCRCVGIEIDRWFVELSRGVIQRYGLTSRVKVIEGRVEDCEEEVKAADLLFFFNPFELHSTREQHRQQLQWLRESFGYEKGKERWLLSIPDMNSIYDRAGSAVVVAEWLQHVGTCRDALLYKVIG